MQTLRETLSGVWSALNPKEPTPRYLVNFMGVAMVIFAVGLLVGQLIN